MRIKTAARRTARTAPRLTQTPGDTAQRPNAHAVGWPGPPAWKVPSVAPPGGGTHELPPPWSARARPPRREPGRGDPRSSPVRSASAVERTNKMGYTVVKFCLFFSGAQKACDQPRTTPTSSGGTGQVQNRAGAHSRAASPPNLRVRQTPSWARGKSAAVRSLLTPAAPPHPCRHAVFRFFFFNFIFHLFHFDGSRPCV